MFSCCFFFFFKQKTAYEMRISDWSSDVCSSDLVAPGAGADFVASKHAGLVKIEPRTARAEQWLDRAATGEASWDGNALVVELRYFPALADGAIAAGLTFERNA